jgi:hypothetical protein
MHLLRLACAFPSAVLAGVAPSLDDQGEARLGSAPEMAQEQCGSEREAHERYRDHRDQHDQGP